MRQVSSPATTVEPAIEEKDSILVPNLLAETPAPWPGNQSLYVTAESHRVQWEGEMPHTEWWCLHGQGAPGVQEQGTSTYTGRCWG
jgi:hypothetical protein